MEEYRLQYTAAQIDQRLAKVDSIPIVDTSLTTGSNNAISNKAVSLALNKKMDDFSIELYNGTAGNPKAVKFATVDYSTCYSEEGILAKISLVSGHGNGTSYAFLEDIIVKVNYLDQVEINNYKYYGTAAGLYDDAQRAYGDIFWTIDSTNKLVYLYILVGQYSRTIQTPWKRLTYSTKGTITQHTTGEVFSSGTKTWANNNVYAVLSNIPTKTSQLLNDNNLIQSRNNGIVLGDNTIGTGTFNHTIVIGSGSKIATSAASTGRSVEGSAIFGFNHLVERPGCLIAGAGHQTSADYQTMLGCYSNYDSGAKVIVGNGTANAKKTIFTIGADGTRSTVSTDAVTVGYLSKAFKSETITLLYNDGTTKNLEVLLK